MLLLLSCGGALAPADNAVAESSSMVARTLQDTRLYFTAPLRWDATDWSYFGGTVALIAAAHEYDGTVRDHFADKTGVVLDGRDRHSTRDALPAAALVAGTWAYAVLIEDSHGYAEGWSMLEAAGLSAVSSYALKFVAGRERPNETLHVDSWRNSGDSFPSLHASAAFAIGTVLAESGNDEYRWIRRGLGYGIAAGTAYRRLEGNAHWLSDTVAGAAIGIATANFVIDRREHHGKNGKFGRLELVPLDRGVLLTYSAPLQ
jgi:membrane-associated phospholipid phosphatase